MRVRSHNSVVGNTPPQRTRSSWGSARRFATIALVLVYSVGMLVVGMAFFRAMQPHSPSTARVSLRDIPRNLVGTAKNYFEAAWRQEPIEQLHLDIKFKDLEKLREKRNEALRIGTLVASDDDFVSATIQHNGRSIKTKLRLKGDLLDHLYGDKWSFRIHTKKNDQLFGMRRFSLQAPRVRDFQTEPIFLSHLRREGVLTPRYFFVDVTVNGKDIGTMAIEEHFSKELLESQQRREGVILRFDESAFWNNRSLNGTFGPFSNPLIAMIRPFRSGKVAKSPKLAADLSAAIGLMRGFLTGKLKPHEVFDVELMARFMSIAEIWNAHHALAWHNLRFYFNPLTARLEPVVFDGHLMARPLGPGLIVDSGYFTPLLLDDPEFREVFVRTLRRIAGDMADGSLVTWAREMEQELIPTLQEGLQMIVPLGTDLLVRRAKNLTRISTEQFSHFRTPLGRPDMRYPNPINVYLCQDCTPSHVEFVNALPVPVEIVSLELTHETDGKTTVTDSLDGLELPFRLPPTEFLGSPTPLRIALDPTFDPKHLDLEVVTQVLGQERRQTLRASPYFDPRKASPIPTASVSAALARHPFLKLDADGSTLRIGAGIWDVDGSLVIPEGMGLILAAGTELRFELNQALIATGALLFQGSAEEPIMLRPRPGVETWGGVAGIRSNAGHVWTHVVVESTLGIEHEGWRLTGGVTLRAADVKISDSVFRGHRGEDALNLVRTRFELENVDFYDTASDALDADYSDGVIRKGRFSRIGGDGIDVSGAKIDVYGTLLNDIADKAISVGEGSELVVRDVHIERVGTGVASKDRSKLVLSDSVIIDASVAGVSVYTKKPEYGPASAVLRDVEMKDVATPVLVQTGSRATIDGQDVADIPLDTKSLY